MRDAWCVVRGVSRLRFPVLETIDGAMRPVIEIDEGTGGDEVFAAALAGGEEKGDIGDLLGEHVDGAIDPDDLLVGTGEARAAGTAIFPDNPGGDVGGKGFSIFDF